MRTGGISHSRRVRCQAVRSLTIHQILFYTLKRKLRRKSAFNSKLASFSNAGQSSWSARLAHNQEVVGSNPTPATIFRKEPQMTKKEAQPGTGRYNFIGTFEEFLWCMYKLDQRRVSHGIPLTKRRYQEQIDALDFSLDEEEDVIALKARIKQLESKLTEH